MSAEDGGDIRKGKEHVSDEEIGQDIQPLPQNAPTLSGPGYSRLRKGDVREKDEITLSTEKMV